MTVVLQQENQSSLACPNNITAKEPLSRLLSFVKEVETSRSVIDGIFDQMFSRCSTFEHLISSCGTIVCAFKFNGGVYLGTDSLATTAAGVPSIMEEGKFEKISRRVMMMFYGSEFRKMQLMTEFYSESQKFDLEDVRTCACIATGKIQFDNEDNQNSENLRNLTVGGIFVGFSETENEFLICAVDSEQWAIEERDYVLRGSGETVIRNAYGGHDYQHDPNISPEAARILCLRVLHRATQLAPESCGGDKYLVRIDGDGNGIHEQERVAANDVSFLP